MKSFKRFLLEKNFYDTNHYPEHEDVDRMHDSLAEHYHTSNYDKAHKSSIYEYGIDSGLINSSLISQHKQDGGYDGSDKDIEYTSNHLSDAIKRSRSLPHTLHVYSGTGIWDPRKDVKEGIVHTPAFTSTSLSKDVAHGFSGAGPKSSHILHFELPAGYKKGMYVEHLKDPDSGVDSEYEYLLDKGQNWKLVNSHPLHDEHDFHIATYHKLVPHEE